MRERESIYCLNYSLGSGSVKQKRNAVWLRKLSNRPLSLVLGLTLP
jgi:hypothetical protein